MFLKKEALIKYSTSKIIMHCDISLFYCLIMLKKIEDIFYFFICNKTFMFLFSVLIILILLQFSHKIL